MASWGGFLQDPLEVGREGGGDGDGDDFRDFVGVVFADEGFDAGVVGGAGFDEEQEFAVVLDGAFPAVAALDGEGLDAGGEFVFQQGFGEALSCGGIGDGGDDHEGLVAHGGSMGRGGWGGKRERVFCALCLVLGGLCLVRCEGGRDCQLSTTDPGLSGRLVVAPIECGGIIEGGIAVGVLDLARARVALPERVVDEIFVVLTGLGAGHGEAPDTVCAGLHGGSLQSLKSPPSATLVALGAQTRKVAPVAAGKPPSRVAGVCDQPTVAQHHKVTINSRVRGLTLMRSPCHESNHTRRRTTNPILLGWQ